MHTTRRTFLKSGAAVAASATTLVATARPLLAQLGSVAEPVPPIQDPRIKQLTQQGLDSARTAGAAYADVRLTYLRKRGFYRAGDMASDDQERMTVGVRALVDGYWGFASGPVWSSDEMARLGRAAVHLARTNALGKPRRVELAPRPIVKDGHWTMPVKYDPFEVNRLEIMDYLGGLYRYAGHFPGFAPDSFFQAHIFTCMQKAFGSTDGGYWTQQTYSAGGVSWWSYRGENVGAGGTLGRYLSTAGKGWEMYSEQPLREYLRQLYEELKEDASLPPMPVDVGRYDAVLDVEMTADLIGQSIGAATQLDRAFGYEANAGGTSYVNDPETMLGTFRIGSPLLNITANRNTPGAAATVQWDDEGVVPDEFSLVKEGVLADFQTTRESAGWMKGWANFRPDVFRSHGCANAPEGANAPLVHTPNLVMTPGSDTTDQNSLVAGMTRGILFKNGQMKNITMDFQQLNGYGGGYAYEVKNGKRVARLMGAGIQLKTPEFWKSLQAVGGARSVVRYGMTSKKGEPSQECVFSVDAAPVAVKDLTIIDRTRKA